MKPDIDIVLAMAEVISEAAATNEAALAGDLDEARFRARLTASAASDAGLGSVALAADELVDVLGPVGGDIRPGLGAAMVKVADALEAVGFDPL